MTPLSWPQEGGCWANETFSSFLFFQLEQLYFLSVLYWTPIWVLKKGLPALKQKKFKISGLENPTWKKGYLHDLPDARHLILWACLGPLLAQLFCAQQEWVSWTFTVFFLFLDPQPHYFLFSFNLSPPNISSWKEKKAW